ncbi:MAG: Ricin-type beta-trefoil lectin domain [Pseudomonadota bacterium]|jgi:hypothetical protein
MWRWGIFLIVLNGCTTYVERYEIVNPSNTFSQSSNQIGQIMNGKQHCLTVNNGQPIRVAMCNNDPAQQWVYESQTAILRNPISGLCLDSATEIPSAGVFLAGRTCQNVPSQQWFFDRQNLYNALGWCVDEIKETTQILAALAACSSRPAQQFYLAQNTQPVVPYYTQTPVTTTIYQPTVMPVRTYYSPFFYTYPYFYWSFYYNHAHRPVHHHAPPPRHRPAPSPIDHRDRNRDGHYNRNDLNRRDALKNR